MTTHRSRRFAALTLAAALGAGSASAESGSALDLGLRHRVGDRYALSLTTETDTAIDTRGAVGRGLREDVTLRYAATVEVLEVDGQGLPVRERHEGAQLQYTRPDGSGSLFRDGATFELVHRGDAGVAMYLFGARVEPRIEQIVGGLLAHQVELSVARLVDPGRPVAPGERWPIDAARARAFLRAHGLHGAELDGAATAELRGGGVEPLRLHYDLPVASFALREIPGSSRIQRARGRLEGDLELGPAPAYRPVAHASALALRVNGELAQHGTARPARFVLSRSQSIDQRTEMVREQLAAR